MDCSVVQRVRPAALDVKVARWALLRALLSVQTFHTENNADDLIPDFKVTRTIDLRAAIKR